MTAPPARNDIGGAGNPSRATAKTAFTQQYDYTVGLLGATGDPPAARTALGAGAVGSAVFTAATAAEAQTAIGVARGMQPISAAVATNALTLTLNPTTIEFRSATLGSGTVNQRSVASAINLVISSGSTLGTVSGVASRIAVLAIDNAGTVELAAVNTLGALALDESGVISTTAEGGAGAADSSTVIYSTTARSNVPYRVIGYVTSTQATAGTWATSPSLIQAADGLAADIPPSRIANALNATGSAPMYACRAWVNFNGSGTVAIRASGNVSSITDLGGSGAYRVNFATAMPDANFSWALGGGNDGTVNAGILSRNNHTASASNFEMLVAGSAGLSDTNYVSANFFR